MTQVTQENNVKTIQDLFNEIYQLNQKIIKNQNILDSLSFNNSIDEYNVLIKAIIEDNSIIKKYRLMIQEANFKEITIYKNKEIKLYKLINIKEQLVFKSRLIQNTIKQLKDNNKIDNTKGELNHKSIMVLSQEAYEVSIEINEVLNILNNFNNSFKIKLG